MKILILGGNRFFGKRLAKTLRDEGHELTIANRGNLEDGLGAEVKRVRVDRTSLTEMSAAFSHQTYDVVYDQIGYTRDDSEIAIQTFSGKIGKFIFTSTQSVYTQTGCDLKETDPLIPYPTPSTPGERYTDGKQKAENRIFDQTAFPVTAIRIPIVLGPDDYTRRLHFHVERTLKGEPIFFPNIRAKISFVHAEDVAKALRFHLDYFSLGIFNVCALEPIELQALMNQIGTSTGKNPNFTEQENETTHSPFGIKTDWAMNAQKMKLAGFEARPILNWLPSLIREMF